MVALINVVLRDSIARTWIGLSIREISGNNIRESSYELPEVANASIIPDLGSPTYLSIVLRARIHAIYQRGNSFTENNVEIVDMHISEYG